MLKVVKKSYFNLDKHYYDIPTVVDINNIKVVNFLCKISVS